MVVNSIYRSIKAVIAFFEEFIPIALRAFYALSPFGLLTWTVYILWGKIIAIFVFVGCLSFILIGVISQYSAKSEGAISDKVKTYIFFINVALLVTVAYADNWFFMQNGTLQFNTPINRFRSEKIRQEKNAVNILNETCAKEKNDEVIISCIKEIDNHRYTTAIPTLELYLRKWYENAATNDANFRVSSALIDALTILQSHTSCELLQEIADKNAKLNPKASDSIKLLCGS